MANLIIKPTSGGSLVLQDEGGDAALTVGTTGSTTLAGTANALGTVVTGNLSNNNIVMPRFKEYDRFLYTTSTQSTSANQDNINISGSNYLTITPEHANDILEFGFAFQFHISDGYAGYGIQKATNTGFSSGVTTIWTNGRHASGQHGHSGDYGNYNESGGSYAIDASTAGMTADTTYYIRMTGFTHTTPNATWGGHTTGYVRTGINFSVKRWSIV